MRLNKFFIVSILFFTQLLLVEAKPIYARLYKQQFGYMPSCLSCHADGGGSPLNNYGKVFKDNGNNIAAFAKIAAMEMEPITKQKQKQNPIQEIKTQLQQRQVHGLIQLA